MNNSESQNQFEPDKNSNISSLMNNKNLKDNGDNYNMGNIGNYETDNYKSASKIYKHTNPSK
jgi:hypothetical protein